MSYCKACATGGQCTSNEGCVARFGLVRHTEKQEPKCNPHPKAPHGFNRNASHANDRYTCECEGWDAYEAGYQAGVMAGIETAMGEEQEQEPVAWMHPSGGVLRHLSTGLERDTYTIPLYTSPPQHALMAEHWKEQYEQLKAQHQPLTDEQARAIIGNVANIGDGLRIARAIEAAHGIMSLQDGYAPTELKGEA